MIPSYVIKRLLSQEKSVFEQRNLAGWFSYGVNLVNTVYFASFLWLSKLYVHVLDDHYPRSRLEVYLFAHGNNHPTNIQIYIYIYIYIYIHIKPLPVSRVFGARSGSPRIIKKLSLA